MTTENTAHAQSIAAMVQAGVINGGVTLHTDRAPSSIPYNLPSGTRRFVGRAAEIRRLNELVTSSSGSRVCVLDGPPGIGKTALAVRWADVQRELFPDGQVYVDLRGFDETRAALDSGTAAWLVLNALHVPLASIPPDPDARTGLLRGMLHQRRLLLILDNVRDSAQVRPLLPTSLDCFTLVTARHRLDGLDVHHDAERIPLGPLTTEESVQLLARRLGTSRVESENKAVERIVAACGGHPLALNIVAARAADEPASLLTPVVKALESKDAALDTLRMPDVADMRAVFALSYDNLVPAVAEGFRTLALHPGSEFNASAAAAMIDGDLFQAREVISELIRCHLLSRTSAGRYAFHALTHAFGADTAKRLDSAQRCASVLVALLNHQVHAASRADRLINAHRRPVPMEPCLRPDLLPSLANRADALAWFDAEYDNVLAAIGVAAENEFHPYVWQLAWTTSNFAYLTARRQEWIDTHATALVAIRKLGDAQVEVRLQQQLARAHRENGDHERSAELYLEALDNLDMLGDVPGRANAFNGLAAAHLHARSFDRALDAGSRALELYELLGDDTGTASTAGLLGQACRALREPVEAKRYHQRAEELYTRSGNLYGLAHVADSMADLESDAGRVGPAGTHLKRAVELHHQVGNLNYAAKSCRRLRALLPDSDPLAQLLSAAIAALEDNRTAAASALVRAIARPG
ncbi:tetratricopeptide repeat protein [Saccharothrix sp. Mg75]|uniref:tetratricopeptide repeat protein n=1 Tax=Saccharothrix sp. Mg75 TaxID=3445357 RepID=UPI003EE8B914